jgi:hypothetical protein
MLPDGQANVAPPVRHESDVTVVGVLFGQNLDGQPQALADEQLGPVTDKQVGGPVVGDSLRVGRHMVADEARQGPDIGGVPQRLAFRN